tara:strand:+ start:340 stop:549 length:210 start_codon:yes stop_codon:yes gene_type:complete
MVHGTLLNPWVRQVVFPEFMDYQYLVLHMAEVEVLRVLIMLQIPQLDSLVVLVVVVMQLTVRTRVVDWD